MEIGDFLRQLTSPMRNENFRISVHWSESGLICRQYASIPELQTFPQLFFPSLDFNQKSSTEAKTIAEEKVPLRFKSAFVVQEEIIGKHFWLIKQLFFSLFSLPPSIEDLNEQAKFSFFI